MNQKETLTVIIPCYNEENNIEKTFHDVQRVIPCLPLDAKVMLIDDGSLDNTWAVMERIKNEFPNTLLVRHPKNTGVGRVVLEAYKVLPSDTWVTVIPGDNEIMFESIKNHLALRGDFELILGYFQNAVIRPFRRRLASALFSLFVRVFYGLHYRYLNGLKLYRASIFKDIEVLSSGHGFNAELIAKAVLRKPDLRIGEAPFLSRGRQYGRSKAFKLSSILKSLFEFFRGYKSVSAYRQKIIQKGLDG